MILLYTTLRFTMHIPSPRDIEHVCFGFSVSRSDSTILKSEKLSFQWCLVWLLRIASILQKQLSLKLEFLVFVKKISLMIVFIML